MPSTLPAVTSVRPSSTIERTRGDWGSAMSAIQNRPVTLGSSVVPEMSLPPRSMISTSMSSNGSGATSARACSVSSRSAAPPTSSARNAVHGDDVVERRLDRGDAAEQAAGVAQGGDAGEEVIAHPDGGVGVELGGSRLLAEADDRHLRAAALDRALERRVRLDPVDGHDPVGPGGVGVEVEPAAVGGVSDDFGVHRRPDLCAERVLGHAELGQHRPLPVRGGPAMAAHRRHHEGIGAELAQAADGAPQQLDAGRQPAAAGADGHGHPGGDIVAQGPHDLVVRLGLDVVDSRWVGDAELDLGQRRDGDRGVERQVDPDAQLLPSHVRERRTGSVQAWDRCGSG